MLTRALATASPVEDVQFSLQALRVGNQLYSFSVAVLDNAGGNVVTMLLQDTRAYTLGGPGSGADLVAPEQTPAGPQDFTGALFTTTGGPGAPSVTLRAAFDADNLYLLAAWTDATGTESTDKDQWTFDGSGWTRSGDEDRLAFMWNINATDWTGTDGCLLLCHTGESPGDGGRMRTNAPGETVDVWHWKAHRTNPVGFSDDKFFVHDNPTGNVATRRGDIGAAAATSNIESSAPAFGAQDDPGAQASYLFDCPPSSERAVTFSPAGFTANDSIPGIVLRAPWGSRAEVRAQGAFSAGAWTVMLTRALVTARPAQDVQFDVAALRSGARVYLFSVAVLDDAGGNPGTMAPQDATSYALGGVGSGANLVALRQTPTQPADFQGPVLATAGGAQVPPVRLRAAFDSRNLYILASWEDAGGSASLGKDRWTFDGTGWSRSGNEDRVMLMWNINISASDWAGCSTLCHVGESPGAGGRMRTNLAGETADIWHWKAARSNPVGFADDKHLVFDTPNGGQKTRLGDAGRAAAVDNVDSSGQRPQYQAAADPGAGRSFLFLLPQGGYSSVSIATLLGGPPPGGGIPPPPGGGSVTFAAEVEPILAGNCACHRNGNRSGGLSLDTFNDVLAGGSSNATNPAVVPVDGAGSLIYQKVSMDTPPVGNRMPLGGPFLSPQDQQTIRDWIDQGANP